MITYEFRPLDWTDPVLPGKRKIAQFRATYPDTLNLLFGEVQKLGGKHLVLQVDIRERDIRADGLPRANARHGENPGVIVSFESRHGPLRYATDTYTDWQDNLRAIALALGALRAVDRYGVSRRGEQYTGWRAIAAPKPVFADAAAAETWMRGYGAEMLGQPGGRWAGSLSPLYKAMAKRMHPDAGGERAEWDRLDEARRVLAEAGVL